VGFSQDVKRELCGIDPDAGHCRRAETAGLLFGAGTVELGAGGSVAVRVSVALPAITRRLLELLRPYGTEPTVRTVEAAPRGRRYELLLGGDLRGLQALNELGVLTDDYRVRMSVPERLVREHCCLVAFTRGMFLGCGSVSTPGAAVHAEFTLVDADLARELAAQLERLGLTFAVAERDRNAACYTKRAETAADLLAAIGAHAARLRWEEHAVLGRVREDANRRANCDQANARRAAAAASRQTAAARRLVDSDAWSGAPAAVREAARLRLAHPYLDLEGLAGAASPPLSKSALNHRLRRMEGLVAELAPERRTAVRSRPSGDRRRPLDGPSPT
jgi:DNA-binding protein WhiA